MRASQYFLPTLREVPAEAEVVSHRLLLRAGFIRRLAAGVYSYLPLGYRVHEKLAQIVREEMNAIGGLEFHMPVLVPRELLEETGRDKVDVLFPMKDRGDRSFFLGFTHEEVITDIARNTVNSWKQLPFIFYQIQTKFRDEPRPRGGLLRGREFTMKDAYSFDAGEEGLDRAYQLHRTAYGRIFGRCGLEYLEVDADPGAIGGSMSAEFMVLAESGEDTVLRCESCGYAANAERAAVGGGNAEATPADAGGASRVVETPGAHTVQQVCDFLKVGPEKLIKTIIVTANGGPAAALVRGDRELNLPKLGRVLGGPAELADAETVRRVTGAPVGFAGPVGLSGIRVLTDAELVGTSGMVAGANQADAHRVDLVPGADFELGQVADIRTAISGDLCGQEGCPGRYTTATGIEVGHIFKLGTKYSQSMKAQVQDETGKNVELVMGCYGLGISRTIASAIEAHHDDDGIVWPVSIAPFEAVVVLVNHKDDAQRAAAEKLYEELKAQGVDALYDDREERSGVKFKDADLIGYPVKVVVGRSLAEGNVEVSLRREKGVTRAVPVDGAAPEVARLIAEEKQALRGT
jgi:prolyl-tRNA synthetase